MSIQCMFVPLGVRLLGIRLLDIHPLRVPVMVVYPLEAYSVKC